MRFVKTDNGITISREADGFVLGYSRECERRRGMRLVEEFAHEPVGFSYAENPRFQRLGVMVDCSRGAVLKPDAFCRLVDTLSGMGYNEIQLYTEDTYTVEGQPYFGYLRGRYSPEELRQMDAYAEERGLELVPCIQTLAHLEHVLRWRPYIPLRDVKDILLAGDDKVYELLDNMFASLSQSLKSRRINIGMDEAHMLGLGKYLERNGYQNRFDIMLSHLKKVMEIAEKYGYQTMMWSDMFFRLASQGEYYSESSIPDEVLSRIPEGITLAYWDYYSETSEKYDRMLLRHKQMKRPVAFAGGAWRWHGFTPGNEFSLHVGACAVPALEKHEIREVIITSWADNGAEGSLFAMLPTFQFWAESCYASNNREAVARRFRTCVGTDFESFMRLDAPLFLADNPSPGHCGASPTKALLYQDILLGLLDNHVDPAETEPYYAALARELDMLACQVPVYGYLFRTQAALCRLLSDKAGAGVQLTKAYRDNDRETLKRYADTILPRMLASLEQFQEAFRAQWNTECKVFGLDVFDLRTGGLRERILSARRTLNAYLKKEILEIPEFVEERLPFAVLQNGGVHPMSGLDWHQIATPSGITGI